MSKSTPKTHKLSSTTSAPAKSLPPNLEEAAKTKTYTASLGECRASFGLRCSARYLHPRFRYLAEQVLNKVPTTTLGKLVARPIDTGVQPEYADEGVKVVKIGTMKNGYFDWSDAQFVDEDFYADYARRAGLKQGDIVVSSTGAGSLGKIDLWDADDRAIVTIDVNIVRAALGRSDPAFLVHLLRHRVVQWQVERELAGATNQIHIYGSQLARLTLPIFPADVLTRLKASISAIVKEMAETRKSLRLPADIINEVLCNELNYPLKEHQERSRLRHYSAPLSVMAAGTMLRNSTRYHHPDFELGQKFFLKHPEALQVKRLLLVPIRLGATATKADLLELGDAYYVHPGASRKQTAIDLGACHQISAEFYNGLKRRFSLRRGDIVLNRAGEGTIGKAGIWEADEDAIFSDFTMRLRLDETKANRLYVWYFLRSVMFQAQVEQEKRGMGNMTNIFPAQVGSMHVICCARGKQDRIAAHISEELKKLRTAQMRMIEIRKKIDALLDKAIGLA